MKDKKKIHLKILENTTDLDTFQELLNTRNSWTEKIRDYIMNH